MRLTALITFALLAGCATTTTTVDAPSALTGRELDTALNLYGRWDEKILLGGRPHYVWRRGVTLNGQTYFCELRSQLGYRNTIASAVVEGYPAACSLFSVQYRTGYDGKAKPDEPRTKIVAAQARNYRPVGAPSETASVSEAARDASARPQ
ncbi:hypothetical protein [Phenylobacterium sp.]|jgi:hypothetical protein|uniref:hypothetical protein n=1 Tax=Phenylobacterium sp. TaxID=1871053 RepID=UPI002F91E2BE